MGLQAPFWRAVAVFRFAALAYPVLLVVLNIRRVAHPAAACLVLAAMATWSAWAAYAYAEPARRGWPLLVADLVATAGALLGAVWSMTGRDGLFVPALPGPWLGGVVLAWAVSGGRRRGAVAALLVGGVDLAARGVLSPSSLSGVVLMLLAGVVVGHVSRLALAAEEQSQRAVELEAATRERDRLARSIHDSVLQVLALVQRRGTELGGEAADLGRLAGEQEAALRALVGASNAVAPTPGGPVDLRALLSGFSSTGVSVATPATPVPLPGAVAAEIAAAVAAALDNVRRHCPPGTRAWLLVEDEGAEVAVTVRDDGPGMPADRLDEAALAGRLGVAQSIRGRVRDLGGMVTVDTGAGRGTEIELRVPRAPDSA